jgi:tetratricopeptide (TPR) repeat protein
LDPRNPELLETLAVNYSCLRRFQDAQRTLDRVIQLRKPERPELLVTKVWFAFSENADVKAARAACESLPSLIKDDPFVVSNRVYFAICARDYAAAEEILRKDRNEEYAYYGALVPREFCILWLEFIQGDHPTIEQFSAVREQLNSRVQGDPTNPFLIAALAWTDLSLGRKEEAIEEGRRAMELRPISEDAFDGPDVATVIAGVYAWANQLDAAFTQLNILVKIPAGHVNYGELKTDPSWDPLRKDPRFDKLLTELAPKD